VAYLERWKPYKTLWKSDQDRKDMLQAGLQDFVNQLRFHGELEADLNIEPDFYYFGQSVVVSAGKKSSSTQNICSKISLVAEKLKFGLLTEVKACTYRIGQALRKKHKREMDYVYAVVSEMDRKLDRPIRDLDDVRVVMDTLKKIRDQEVDMELRIDPIEVICRQKFLRQVLILISGSVQCDFAVRDSRGQGGAGADRQPAVHVAPFGEESARCPLSPSKHAASFRG